MTSRSGPMLGAPGPHPPLQGPSGSGKITIRMSTLHLLEHRDGAQSRRGHQQRHDLFFPKTHQRIGLAAGMTADPLLLRWRARVAVNPPSRACTEPGLGRGNLLAVMRSQGHVVLVLSVGDETAGHPILFLVVEDRTTLTAVAANRTGANPGEILGEATPGLRPASASPKITTCDVAHFHEQCR